VQICLLLFSVFCWCTLQVRIWILPKGWGFTPRLDWGGEFRRPKSSSMNHILGSSGWRGKRFNFQQPHSTDRNPYWNRPAHKGGVPTHLHPTKSRGGASPSSHQPETSRWENDCSDDKDYMYIHPYWIIPPSTENFWIHPCKRGQKVSIFDI